MIITIVTETYAPDINGVAMTLGVLLSGLSGRGHEIQLVCTSSNDRNTEYFPPGVSYYPVKSIAIPRYSEARFGLPSKKLLRNLWASNRPDVIYVATEGPLGLSAIKLAKKSGIPVVSGFHTNFQSYGKHYGLGMLSRIVENYLVSLHNKSGVTLTPTINQKHKLNDMGIKNVSVLGRGVDTELFSPAKRSLSLRMSWGVLNDHEPVLLYVGRIAAEKNLRLAVKTYQTMYKMNNDIKFVLVGDGPLLGKMKKENPGFIFAGIKESEELAKYYASSDIFVFPSLTETYGNVVLEAMASGLGVIAYDYASANMNIQHGVNGMLANEGNSYDFIVNACEYMNNYDFLEELKSNARQQALKMSWDKIICEFEDLLTAQAYKSFRNYVSEAEGLGTLSH